MLLDEFDAGNANIIVTVNSAIDNGFIGLPNGETIFAHENFRIVATANTNLKGAKDGFTARNKLDAATINRFSVIDWKLDEDLEQKITGNDDWLKIVRVARATAELAFDDIVITPRSAYKGAKLLANTNLSVDKIIDLTIVQGLGEDVRKILTSGITETMKENCRQDVKVDVEKTIEVQAKDEDDLDNWDDEDDANAYEY